MRSISEYTTIQYTTVQYSKLLYSTVRIGILRHMMAVLFAVMLLTSFSVQISVVDSAERTTFQTHDYVIKISK